MEGPQIPGNDENLNRGMISRAVEQIFETTGRLKEQGWTYDMRGSFLEIYNDSIRDLLTSSSVTGKKYEIKHDIRKGKTWVTDLTVGKDILPVNTSRSNEEDIFLI